MGGRGAAGATYRRRISLATRLADASSEIKAIEDEAATIAHARSVEAFTSLREYTRGWNYPHSMEDIAKESLDSGKSEAQEFLDNSRRYSMLKDKQAALSGELKMLNAGQMRMF